ncbi:MAG: NUDIX domain-containing protein [Alphaproteobacteria bacterium]|nr:NUDIX domain-containing protein [Alphaproteobacteria bacterium]
MNHTDVELIERETLFQGWMRLERLHLRHALFQGGVSQIFTREVLIRNAAVALLPYDPVTDRVCLIEQFRCGTYVGSDNPWSIEIVAGLMDKTESTEHVARREAQEEAGLAVKRVRAMPGGFTMPGSCDEFFHFFVGEVALPDTQSKVFGLVEEHENIRTHIISRAESIEWMDSGKIKNLPTLYALSWFARFGDGLRAEWGSNTLP